MKRSALSLLLIALVGVLLCVPMSEAEAKGLNNISVTGPATGPDGNSQTFTGRLTITELGLQGEELVASGFLVGRVDRHRVAQSFDNIPVALTGTSQSVQQLALACNILFLNLGPLELDLLGLTVDLSEVTLDINAVPGPGNLLGNLLCALAGLLDGLEVNVISAILQALLNAINQLL